MPDNIDVRLKNVFVTRTTDAQRLAGECKAVADGIRHLRATLLRQMHWASDLPTAIVPDVMAFCVSGLDAAMQLEAIAAQLGEAR